MKEITSIYKAPMVIALLDRDFGRLSTSRNLLPGETITVEDNQISPECKVLEKKKCITIVDKVVPPTEEEKEAEELAALEKELLEVPTDDQE